MILRGARGLGDAVYLYPVLKYYQDIGKAVEVLTSFPEIYLPLCRGGLRISERTSKKPDRECRYGPRYHLKDTTTFQDTLIQAGIEEDLNLEIDIEPMAVPVPAGKKICVVRAPAFPMQGREDTRCLIPDDRVIQAIIDANKNRFFFVLAGSRNAYPYLLRGIDLDLTNKLGIVELLNLVQMADVVLTQPSFMLPFAEALGTRCFVLFSGMAMKVPRKFYHFITPRKIINRPDLVGYAIDDDGTDKAVAAFAAEVDRASL